MDKFKEFWNEYPRQSGIGAARQQWQCETMFKRQIACQIAETENLEDHIIEAAKQFRDKHRDTEEQFIPLPKKFLSEQTYLDKDLHKKKEQLPDWQEKLAASIGMERMAVFKKCTMDGNKLKTGSPAISDLIKRNYANHLERVFGMIEVVV